MNKPELIAAVAEKAGLSKKDAEAAVKAVFDSVTAAMAAGEKVQIIGFGTFAVKERAARSSRVPGTDKVVEVPAAKIPGFKPGAALKDAVK